jgi:hypothetical protein
MGNPNIASLRRGGQSGGRGGSDVVALRSPGRMIELLESWSTIQNRANQALSGGITSVAEIVRISAEYDEEAKVWVAQSDDIPLVTEADTVEQLLGKIPGLIQDLVEDGDTRDNIPFRLNFHAESSVPIRAA